MQAQKVLDVILGDPLYLIFAGLAWATSSGGDPTGGAGALGLALGLAVAIGLTAAKGRPQILWNVGAEGPAT